MTPRNPKLWVFLVLAIVWIVSVVLGFDTWYHLGLPGKDPQPELATCGVAGFAVAATIYVIAFRHTWHLSWRALFLAITLGLLTGITAVTWHVQRLEL
jgi:hypothetical protein